MRLWALAMAGALVASCGESGSKTGDAKDAAGQVTVTLPPAVPAAAPEPAEPAASEPEATPPVETPAAAPKEEPAAPPPPSPKVEAPAPTPEPATEPAEPEAEATPTDVAPEAPEELPEANPPIAAEGLAGYIRGAGFECDRVVATRRAAGNGPYKFDCAEGGSYRGTMRRGRLYFRPWRGGSGN